MLLHHQDRSSQVGAMSLRYIHVQDRSYPRPGLRGGALSALWQHQCMVLSSECCRR